MRISPDVEKAPLGAKLPLWAIVPDSEWVDNVSVPVYHACIETELIPKWRAHLAQWLRMQRSVKRSYKKGGTDYTIPPYPSFWERIFVRQADGWIRIQ